MIASALRSLAARQRGVLRGVRARLFGELMGEGDPQSIRLLGKRPSLLVFHGFGGTPLEVELVARAVHELGFEAHAPLLPGHGQSVAALARTGWSDWSDAACGEIEALPDTVVVAGLSLGSLLAAQLAIRYPERVLGLIMLASATRLMPPTTTALRLFDLLGVTDFAIPKLAPDIADPDARRSHLTYGSQSVRAALSLLDAAERVRASISAVSCPTLIVHGARDRVCPASNAHEVASLVGTPRVRVEVLPHSRHIITRDLEHAELARMIQAFYAEIVATESPGTAA
jgi:carboxylesterase